MAPWLPPNPAFDLPQHAIQPCQAQQTQSDLQQTKEGLLGGDDDPTEDHVDPRQRGWEAWKSYSINNLQYIRYHNI